MLKRAILGNPAPGTNLAAGDLNRDGNTNSTDLMILRRYLLKLIGSLLYNLCEF